MKSIKSKTKLLLKKKFSFNAENSTDTKELLNDFKFILLKSRLSQMGGCTGSPQKSKDELKAH